MEGARNAVLVCGATSIPNWLLSRLLRAVGADRSDLAGKTDTPGPPVLAPRPTRPAASAEQAISMARDTVGRFYRVRWRPAYKTAEVDEFIARIEAALTSGTRPGRAVTAADVDAVKFGTTRNGGYDEQLVDKALDHYAAGLARLVPPPD
jgi:hypothetical protein